MDLRTQKYKICINTNWLVMIGYGERDQLESKAYPVFIMFQSPGTAKIRKIIGQMLDHSISLPVIICSKSPEKTWKLLLKSMPVIYAAGGVVLNPTRRYLFIYRREWWDLPKGKIEKGESTRKAALREVKEEVGLDCKIISKLNPTYHVYLDRKEVVIKETSWYLMQSPKSKPKLQKEEDIVNYAWKTSGQLNGMKHKVYPNLSVLIEELKLEVVVGG